MQYYIMTTPQYPDKKTVDIKSKSIDINRNNEKKRIFERNCPLAFDRTLNMISDVIASNNVSGQVDFDPVAINTCPQFKRFKYLLANSGILVVTPWFGGDVNVANYNAESKHVTFSQYDHW